MVSDIKISEHIISLGSHVEFPINTNQNLRVLSLVSEKKIEM